MHAAIDDDVSFEINFLTFVVISQKSLAVKLLTANEIKS
jgi:hypothetical protein